MGAISSFPRTLPSEDWSPTVDGDRDPQVDGGISDRADDAPSARTGSTREANGNGGRSRKRSGGRSSRADASPRRDDEADGISSAELRALLDGLRDLRDGDFSARLARPSHPLMGDIAHAFNDVATRNERMARELERVADTIGQGDMTARASLAGMSGGWAESA